MSTNQLRPSSPSSFDGICRELAACYQCRRCSAGCPVAPWADEPPHRLVRRVREGEVDRAASGNMIWLCAHCQTCSQRCPNGVPVAELMDALKQVAMAEGVPARESDVVAANEAFLKEVQCRGRIHELSLIGRYKLKTGHFFSDMALGLALFMRGKLKLIPPRRRVPAALRGKKKQ